MTDRLRRLGEISQMILDAELARLRDAEDRRNDLARQADSLRQARKKAVRQAAPDPAHLTGTHQRFDAWASKKLGEYAQREALAAAEVESGRSAAATAFGRRQALRTLLARQLAKRGKRP